MLHVNAGEMRSQITVQSATQTRDAHGGATETFAEFVTTWAEINPLTAREFVSGNQITQDVSHRIRMRYYPGVTPSMRILFGARVFNIHSVINANERNKFMELLVKERLN